MNRVSEWPYFGINAEPIYGFDGIGVMGYGMAKNMRETASKARPFILCEVNQGRREQFMNGCGGEEYVGIADSPKQVTEMAEIIITMVLRAEHIRDAFRNSKASFLAPIAQATASVRFFIDSSSIDATTSITIGEPVAEKSNVWSFIDDRVSGGPAGAEAGKLSFMGGYSSEHFDQALRVLSMMGTRQNIYHCGGPGAGLATKQLNNYIAHVGYLRFCEVMNTGLLYGKEPASLSNVINSSSGMNWNSLHQNRVKGVNPNASSARAFEGGFTTELVRDVIDGAVALMREVGCRTVLAVSTQAVFSAARQSEPCKGMEARSVWRLFNERVERTWFWHLAME